MKKIVMNVDLNTKNQTRSYSRIKGSYAKSYNIKKGIYKMENDLKTKLRTLQENEINELERSISDAKLVITTSEVIIKH